MNDDDDGFIASLRATGLFPAFLVLCGMIITFVVAVTVMLIYGANNPHWPPPEKTRPACVDVNTGEVVPCP